MISERNNAKGQILYNSIYMIFWKMKAIGTEIRQVVARNWDRERVFTTVRQ